MLTTTPTESAYGQQCLQLMLHKGRVLNGLRTSLILMTWGQQLDVVR